MSPEDSPGALQAVLVTFLGHLRAGVLTQAPANVGAQVSGSRASGPTDQHAASAAARKAGAPAAEPDGRWADAPPAG